MPEEYVSEYNTSKPPIIYNYMEGRDNIVIIGDSFTEGAGVSYNETYSYFLSRIINANVINLGVGGYNTKMEIKRFKEIGEKYNPKLVIIQYYNNDIEDTLQWYTLVWNVFLDLENKGYSCGKDEIQKKNHIITELADIYFGIILEKQRDVFFNDNVLIPLKSLNESNLTKIFLFLPSPSWQYEQLLPVLQENNFHIIDIGKELRFKELLPPFSISKDDAHFSVETHKKVGDLLYQKITILSETLK